jgi:hypothetical protein
MHSVVIGAGHESAGASRSTTVIVPEHDAVSPSASATVSDTLVLPSAKGPLGVSVTVMASLSGSLEPAFTDPLAEHVPGAVSSVTSWQSASGGRLLKAPSPLDL